MNCSCGQLKDGLEKSKAFSLKELVDYSKGAIVSKTLSEDINGTITLFAFDSDQGLSEHSAPFDAMIQVVEGETVVTIGGTAHHLKCGELIIMPADIPHAVRAKTRFKMLLTMIKSSK